MTSITICTTVLPNQSHPLPYVFRGVTHAQREHDPGFWADSCHTWRQLSGRSSRRHDGWQGATEQRACRFNQLRLVFITPLVVKAQTDKKRHFPREWNMVRKEREGENRHYPFEWTKKLADIGVKLNSRPAKVLFFPSLTNWFGRASATGLIKRRCRPGYAVELALFEKHSMQ